MQLRQPAAGCLLVEPNRGRNAPAGAAPGRALARLRELCAPPPPAPQAPKDAPQEPGASIRAVILDINKRDGILDLSLQPRLLQAAQAVQPEGQQPKKKKQRKGAEAGAQQAPAELREGDAVEATIELVGGWVGGWQLLGDTPGDERPDRQSRARARLRGEPWGAGRASLNQGCPASVPQPATAVPLGPRRPPPYRLGVALSLMPCASKPKP